MSIGEFPLKIRLVPAYLVVFGSSIYLAMQRGQKADAKISQAD